MSTTLTSGRVYAHKVQNLTKREQRHLQRVVDRLDQERTIYVDSAGEPCRRVRHRSRGFNGRLR